MAVSTISGQGRKRWLTLCLLMVITIMFYAGLRDNVPESNQVSYALSDGALVFGERGLAYSRNPLNRAMVNRFNQSGFAIELTFSPLSFENNNFQFLLLFSNGDPNAQLVVAQVRDHIIVMNGDDYNFAQKRPRLSAKITDRLKKYQHLKITVTAESTVLSLNGKSKARKSTSILTIPNSQSGSRLLISGSETLKNNWRGAIKLLAVTPLAINSLATDSIRFVPPASAEHNQTINSWLLIPQKVALLKHQLFFNESFNIKSTTELKDIILNFIGFSPFGWLLAALLLKIPMSFEREWSKFLLLLFATFLCGFLLSFIIEYRQAWLVTRQSSLRDLYLNALGGAFGAILYLCYWYLIDYFRCKSAAEEEC